MISWVFVLADLWGEYFIFERCPPAEGNLTPVYDETLCHAEILCSE